MRVLITGGSGRLAKQLTAVLIAWGHTVLSPPHYYLNICKQNEIKKALEFDPDVVINCAATLSVEAEANNARAYQTNYVGVKNLSDIFSCNKIPLVQISTDYVFDGTGGNYAAGDYTAPLNYYGYTKALAEPYVLASNNLNLVLRAPFRYSINGQWPYPKAFVDQMISPCWVWEIAQHIAKAATDGISGLWHIAPHPPKTVYEMAKEISPEVGMLLRSDSKSVQIPENVTLDGSKWHRYIESQQWKPAPLS